MLIYRFGILYVLFFSETELNWIRKKWLLSSQSCLRNYIYGMLKWTGVVFIFDLKLIDSRMMGNCQLITRRVCQPDCVL